MFGDRNGKVRGLGAFLDENSEIEGKYRCAGTVMLDAKFSGEIMSNDFTGTKPASSDSSTGVEIHSV